ncbi:MAG: helix-turn-helix domain-containing protein [Rhodospirillales bacterium]|nr:helix-turn-helix domain-containing protein [Rhodospirillales bacterium]
MDPTRPPPKRVAMLIYPGVAPLDATGPLQVFGVANYLRRRKLYDLTTLAPSLAPVPTAVGFAFLPGCAMADYPLPVDTLLVSGGGGPDAGTGADILDWLRHAARQSRRFGSICTGAFVLGAAGLLDGKRVTTHWAFGDELARRCPAAAVDIDQIFIRDGPLCSSAGISAGIDLALALVEEDHGRALALEIARYLVLGLKRSGGQAQFSPHLKAAFSELSPIRAAQLWCLEHLDGDLRVPALSQVASMSGRDFARKFRRETGATPADYVAAARLDAARRMLAETGLSVKAIAERSGFGSVAALRRAMVRRVGVSPRRYRDDFQG